MGLFWELLIDFVYPRSCLGCGKNGEDLCIKCLTSFEYADQICPECGEPSVMGWTHDKCRKVCGLDGLVCIYDYQDEMVKKMVEDIKFGFNRELVGVVLGSCEFDFGMKFDEIVPIPLHFYRENWRGFNQSEVIGKYVGTMTGVEVLDGLVRKKKTEQQSLSSSKEERRKNIKGAFEIKDGISFKNKNVFLVDDVFTSGATLREACLVLKKGGAKVVWGFCLAH